MIINDDYVARDAGGARVEINDDYVARDAGGARVEISHDTFGYVRM